MILGNQTTDVEGRVGGCEVSLSRLVHIILVSVINTVLSPNSTFTRAANILFQLDTVIYVLPSSMIRSIDPLFVGTMTRIRFLFAE